MSPSIYLPTKNLYKNKIKKKYNRDWDYIVLILRKLKEN